MNAINVLDEFCVRNGSLGALTTNVLNKAQATLDHLVAMIEKEFAAKRITAQQRMAWLTKAKQVQFYIDTARVSAPRGTTMDVVFKFMRDLHSTYDKEIERRHDAGEISDKEYDILKGKADEVLNKINDAEAGTGLPDLPKLIPDWTKWILGAGVVVGGIVLVRSLLGGR